MEAACGLAVDGVAFHPTVLTYWRRRLAASQNPNRIFSAVEDVIAKTGALTGKTRRVQRSPTSMKPGGCRSSTGKAIFDQEQQRWIWRRAGCRDDLHGVHLRRQDPPGHREVDRASGETVEPESRTAGPRGTVHRVPVPRSVHRFHRIDVDRRSPTPWTTASSSRSSPI